jgi:nitrile hydratase subunit alpha
MSGNHNGSHHPEPASYVALRTRAIESLLIEKGLFSTDAVDVVVQMYEHDIGPLLGARVVARAWTDPEFRARLLEDANAAVLDMGIAGNHLAVVENTPTVHNMVVCTLCSCYPWAVLGLPPSWYKSPAYRSRAVLEPRAVLREFGLELPESTEIRVWDSSAEIRYLVLPLCPAGTDGWTEEQLAALITRDSMIGVADVKAPAAV